MRKKRFIDVAAAVFNHHGLVLVARRAPGQYLEHKWEFPGGKIEKNESAEECLYRELREEFGVTVDVGDYVGESIYSYPDMNIRLVAYEVSVLSGNFALRVHDKISWVKIQDLSTVDLAEADIPISLILQEQILSQAARNQDFYDRHFQEYNDATLQINPAPFLTILTGHLQQGSTVLDIGCGAGRDLLWLKRQGYEPTGFERSVKLAGLARQNSGCLVIEGDFTSYDFSALKFDALILIGALVHLPYQDFAEVLCRVSKAMTCSGMMYLTLKEGTGLTQQSDGRFDSLWSTGHLEGIFRDHGFTVLDFSRNISAMGTGDVWLGYLLKS